MNKSTLGSGFSLWEHKRELGIDLRYLAHIIESEPLEINNWLGLDIAFFDMIFAFAF